MEMRQSPRWLVQKRALGILTLVALGVSGVSTARLPCLWFLVWFPLDIVVTIAWGLLGYSFRIAALGAALSVCSIHLTGLILAFWGPRPSLPVGVMCEDFVSPLVLLATPAFMLAATIISGLLWACSRWVSRRLFAKG